MHDKVYNCLSTESNIGSRKLCMDKLVFVKSFVLPVTPLPPPALEMDTQDAGVSLIRLVARIKLFIFFARSLHFVRVSYSAKFFAVWRILSNCSQVLFLSIPCEMVYGEGFSV